jgi:hypothetical protein
MEKIPASINPDPALDEAMNKAPREFGGGLRV